MPKYRQTHAKILDSVDFNELPDDFTRLTWVLLPLILDSEGRGVDNAAWLRSKIYPMNEQVTLEQIRGAFDCFAARGMIVRYSADGRNYFHIPTWKTYQSGTEKEGKSSIPAPDQLQSNSGVTPEEVRPNQPTNADSDADSNTTADTDSERESGAVFGQWSEDFPPPTQDDGAPGTDLPFKPAEPKKTGRGRERDEIEIFRETTKSYPRGQSLRMIVIETIQRHQFTAEILKPYWETWIMRGYNQSSLEWMTDWAVSGKIPERGGTKSSQAGKAPAVSVGSAIEEAKRRAQNEPQGRRI